MESKKVVNLLMVGHYCTDQSIFYFFFKRLQVWCSEAHTQVVKGSSL